MEKILEMQDFMCRYCVYVQNDVIFCFEFEWENH